jgi:hypothetical protein
VANDSNIQRDFVIRETSGRKREVRLFGWNSPTSSPGSSAFQWATKQRTVRTWYPGNPEATVQVLGPEEEPSRMNLRLDRRWLGGDEKGVGGATVLEDGVTEIHSDPLVFAEVFRSLCREGQEVEVLWGDFVRRGVVASAKISPITDVLVTVEVEFEWHGADQFKVTTFEPSYDFRLPEETWRQRLGSVAAVVKEHFDKAEEFFADMNGLLTQWGTLVEDYASLLDEVLDITEAGRDMVQNLVAISKSIRERCSLISDMCDVEAGALFMTSDISKATNAYGALAAVQDDTMASKAAADEATRAAVALLLGDDVIAVELAYEGATLHAYAAQYYGDAGRWQVIAQYNLLDSPVLSTGMIVAIPVLDVRREG